MNDLTPSEELAGEVLAARWRLGEQAWTFRSRQAKALDGLVRAGFAWTKHGVVDGTILAGLTEEGRDAFLSGSYEPPLLGASA